MKVIRIVLIVAAVIAAGACIWTALNHEPDEETLEFTSEPGQITSDSLNYVMVFTGDLADRVIWDFGDGTSAEAVEVFKSYEEPGDYNVICTAVNDNGERVSAYSLHITESEHDLFDGYGSAIALGIVAVALMALSSVFRGE